MTVIRETDRYAICIDDMCFDIKNIEYL